LLLDLDKFEAPEFAPGDVNDAVARAVASASCV
jgi:hypothetical protein